MRAAFLDSMASNSTSVHVVTTGTGDQRSALRSAPAVQCVQIRPRCWSASTRAAPANAAVAANGVFAVNLLNVAQRGIADTFAGRSATAKPFDFSCCTNTAGTLGVPLIDGAVAALECRVVAQQYWHAYGVFRRSGGRYPARR